MLEWRSILKKIGEIKQEIERCPIDQILELCRYYQQDERKGVQKLMAQCEKKWEAYQKEQKRTEAMWQYEREYEQYPFIGGIDEAGRGSLAGPVVAAAVMLPKDCGLLYVNDSKQLSEAKRELLYGQIMEEAVSVGVGIVQPDVIDEINILQATYEAMRTAIGQLVPTPDLLLNDAVTIPQISIPQVPIIKGDAKSISIAAASIVAKVTRDRMMREYDVLFPEYGFASNKGYGSAAHIESLKAYGPSPIHRNSFIKSFITKIAYEK